MNLEKLKDTARKHEQKEDWRRAIDVYLKAIQEFEAGPEPTPDLSLYNRVGDLYLKINDSTAAVRSYERAVDLYADQGFLNNAIALCGKILRINPSRLPTYLKLAQLHARKNFLHDAKRYLIEYIDRMNGVGELDTAFTAVMGFADQFSNNQEIRLMLVELLRASSRAEEAREQLEKLASELEARGDRAGARKTREQLEAMGHEEGEGEAEPEEAPRKGPHGNLVFLDTSDDYAAAVTELTEPEAEELEAEEPTVPEPLPDLQTTSFEMESTPEVDFQVEGLEQTGPGDLELEQSTPADLEFDSLADESLLEPEAEPDLVLDTEPDELQDADDIEPLAGVELSDEALALEPLELDESGADYDAESLAGSAPPPELPYVDLAGGPDLLSEAEAIAELEDRVLDDPENAEAHRDLADALQDAGDTERAAQEYALARQGYESSEDWGAALGVVDRQIAADSGNVGHHQKRVELAYRSGDRSLLLQAYLGLADLLARSGDSEKAVAVYQRVLEHEPANQHARAAVAALSAPMPPVMGAPPAGAPASPAAPPPPAPPPANHRSGDFVDLGSMIIDSESPRDTRMKVEHEEPTGDEQRDFNEMLDAFKRGIEQNLGSEDYQAHYDLGVAFKEMGLLDEAIAEFQKALRSPEGRLRTSEALGICFFDKQQFAVAEAVLRRAVDGLPGADDEKIGLIYWLGRAAEEQGKDREALACYQRALAVDIRFMDLGTRIHRLSAGQHS